MATSAKTHSKKTSQRLQLSRSPLGYRLGGKLRKGFPDDPALSPAQRRRIAAWARALSPFELTDEQTQLLEQRGRAPSAAQKKAAELASYKRSPYWRHLTDKERSLVEDPSDHGKLRGAGYPLVVSQLATLVNVSEDQIRRWHDAGLLPAARSPGRHRRFYPAAAARAFFLKGLGQNGISVLRQVRKGEAGPLLVGISAVLAEEAATAAPKKQELLQRAAGDLEKVGAA